MASTSGGIGSCSGKVMKCGMRNAECGTAAGHAAALAAIAHAAFELRTPHSALASDRELPFHEGNDHVLDGEVQLLNVGGLRRWNHQVVVDETPHRPSVFAEQAHDRRTVGPRGLHRPDHVLASAAGGVEHEQVARTHEGL